jgi:hypothetical protein
MTVPGASESVTAAMGLGADSAASDALKSNLGRGCAVCGGFGRTVGVLDPDGRRAASHPVQEEVAMTSVIERARSTVDQLLATRERVKSYEERRQYALDLVDLHLHEENPERIDECLKLYTEDAVWECPARGVRYVGRQQIKEMYLRLFASAEGIRMRPIERFATPERVFDDMEATFRLSGDGFENCPFPIGTKVNMRLLHNFHVREGLIEREIGYEVWRRDV